MDSRKIKYIENVVGNSSLGCGYEDRNSYCSKKNIHIDGSECMNCWCYQDSVSMRKRDWNWTDGMLNEELSE